MLGLTEIREGFCWRGRGRSFPNSKNGFTTSFLQEEEGAGKRCSECGSFHVEGPKAEKGQEPTMESLVRRIGRLRISDATRRFFSIP